MEELIGKGILIGIALAVSVLSTVVFHELGHLVGGFISGYHFHYIQMFGIRVERKDNSLKVSVQKILPIGQCIMVPEIDDVNPGKIILGGCVANCLAGVFFLINYIIKVLNEGIYIYDDFSNMRGLFFILSIALVNLVLGMYNLFGSNYYMDGYTYREVVNDYKSMVAYNKLMYIYGEVSKGKKLCEISENKFSTNSIRTGLLAELTLYSCERDMEKYSITKIGDVKSIKSRLVILSRSKYKYISEEARKNIVEFEKYI